MARPAGLAVRCGELKIIDVFICKLLGHRRGRFFTLPVDQADVLPDVVMPPCYIFRGRGFPRQNHILHDALAILSRMAPVRAFTATALPALAPLCWILRYVQQIAIRRAPGSTNFLARSSGRQRAGTMGHSARGYRFIFTLWSFNIERYDRKEDRINQAIANFAGGIGRMDALSILLRNDVSLVALKAPKAFLLEADLQGANLFKVDFREADLREANFRGAQLEESSLVDLTAPGRQNRTELVIRFDKPPAFW